MRGRHLFALLVSLAGCKNELILDASPPASCADALVLADGTCITPGMQPEQCAAGFAHDGDRACEPILPVEPCGAGMMAVPGDTSCREVAPCGDGPWGDIVVEPSTEHVDITYTAPDSDGTAERPWARIQDAVDDAAPGAIVAIAAGSYVEDLLIEGKSVRLWGRCPGLVEIAGSGAEGVVGVLSGSSGTEIHTLAIRGHIGIVASGPSPLLVDRVWVHDTSERGLLAQPTFGATSVHINGSLFERNASSGVYVSGADVTIEASVFRDTAPDNEGFGRGVSAQASPSNGEPARVTIFGSLVERSHDYGILASGSEVAVEATVVRATGGAVARGFGIIAREGSMGLAANLQLQGVFLEANEAVGLLVLDSEAVVDTTVIRGTLPSADGFGGRGISVEASDVGKAPRLTLTSSVIERNLEYGVFAGGAEVTIETSVIRDTAATVLPAFTGAFGQGVHVQSRFGTIPASLSLAGSLLERNLEGGVVVVSAAAAVEATVVRETSANDLGLFGYGMMVYSMFEGVEANASLTNVRLESSASAGLTIFGASAIVEHLRIVCNPIDINGEATAVTSFTVDDRGDNLCGCPRPTEACVPVTLGLEPGTVPP